MRRKWWGWDYGGQSRARATETGAGTEPTPEDLERMWAQLEAALGPNVGYISGDVYRDQYDHVHAPVDHYADVIPPLPTLRRELAMGLVMLVLLATAAMTVWAAMLPVWPVVGAGLLATMLMVFLLGMLAS